MEREIGAAASLFRRFHRFAPERIICQQFERTVPRVLVRLGELRALVYSSDRGRPGRPRSFIHFMQDPPALASDARGRRLFILGGSYRVTPFGIEG
ncbi:MAG: hypothetical protein RMK33_00130 [Arcobacter sp.]|nr:hypothetical protein [Arcobacter sp.]